jgi:hypothetical protein
MVNMSLRQNPFKIRAFSQLSGRFHTTRRHIIAWSRAAGGGVLHYHVTISSGVFLFGGTL